MPEGGLRQGKKEEAQPSNYHQNPISWISGHGRPFWIVLVQLPAFCQRLFGKLIPQKPSDLIRAAAKLEIDDEMELAIRLRELSWRTTVLLAAPQLAN
ncbi:uncharacterized protein Dsimw501_GD27385 [Drosophila simulans]|uniref:Uncharacterized protein n=1 Tax=Drosophila simulans TaxID=7240 RepID=A0A0J9URK7_DROSI|nr:uncharacterized protein Dsimw501_GD27385 [Drosophila simulans]